MLETLQIVAFNDALKNGVRILTPNRRLQSDLQARLFNSENQAKTVIRAPDIQIFSNWINQIYADLVLAGEIESPQGLIAQNQAVALWHQIITADGAVELIEPFAAAGHCHAALRQLQNWVPDPKVPYASGEWRAFSRWRRQFEDRLQSLGLHTTEQRISDVVTVLNRGERAGSDGPVALHGFMEFTPLERNLLEALKAPGAEVLKLNVEQDQQPNEHRSYHTFENRQSEIRAAVAWAHEQFQASPNLRLGLLVNDIDSCRAELKRAIDDIFGEQRDAVSRVGGKPLSQHAVIQDALWLLDLAQRWNGRRQVEFDEISRLLRCPHVLKADEESSARVLLDVALRHRGQYRWNRFALMEWLQQQGQTDARLLVPGLLELLRNFEAVAANSASGFYQLLRCLGWPGDITDGQRPNLVQLFIRQLEGLQQVESVLGPTSGNALLSLFRRQLNSVTFSAESPLAPVQVLALADLPGRFFDHVWVLNMNDQNWPAPAQGNPFLPSSLRHQLPRATAESELGHARATTELIVNCAPEVQASFARHDNTLEFGPSPLLAEWGPVVASAADIVPLPAEQLSEDGGAAFDLIDDSRGLPLIDPDDAESVAVSGGVGILQDQAVCPMVAYAHLRLGARALPAVDGSLSPQDRGILIHQILERFWTQYRDRSQAAQLGDTLTDRVNELVSEAITERKLEARYGSNVVAVTRSHLTGLLTAWIEQELKRPEFVVSTTEQKVDIELGRLMFSGKIDRVDRLDDGSQLLIDYKSGKLSHPKLWLGERLLETQLPVYLQTSFTEVEPCFSGIALAGVAPGDAMGWSGVTEDAAHLDRAKQVMAWQNPASHHWQVKDWPSWEDLRSYWRLELERLAAELASGDCRNQIFDDEQMKYCDVEPLLRRESRLAEDASEGDGEYDRV